MIRGLLVDLDNTLVGIDVDAFIERYTAAVAARVAPGQPDRGQAVIAGATYRMLTQRDTGRTNRDRLLEALAAEVGDDAADLWRRLEEASTAVLPTLRTLAHPLPGARETVLEARRRGLRVALATNPIYPRAVIVERMRWAGLDEGDVDHVASLEVSTDTKPHAAYFAGLAEALGLDLAQCLMVGDDPDQDIPDRATPLRVQILAPAPGAREGSVRYGPLERLWTIWADALAVLEGAAAEG